MNCVRTNLFLFIIVPDRSVFNLFPEGSATQQNHVRDSESLRIHRRFRDSEGFSRDSPGFMQIRWDSPKIQWDSLEIQWDSLEIQWDSLEIQWDSPEIQFIFSEIHPRFRQ